MEEIKFKLAIRTDIKNKPTDDTLKLTASGWSNVDITLPDFIASISSGFPFTHQFINGYRKGSNFAGTNVLIADIDDGLSLNSALDNPFIKHHATLIYTTPSHTEEKNRYRILFHLKREIYDGESYEALYTALMKRVPTDPNARSCAQFFFGNSEAIFHELGKSLDNELINKLIREGMEERYSQSIHNPVSTLSDDTRVSVKNRGLLLLRDLPANTSIKCPFGTHPDKNPSAFVKVNKDGVRGVQCRSCGSSAWIVGEQKEEEGFNFFDAMVKQYNGTANTHFEYQGLTRYDHELEVSKEKSNYHLLNAERLGDINILPGVNLIKSPKGSGKTHSLAKLVSHLKSYPHPTRRGKTLSQNIILIGHRQSLISESASKLGLECYLDTGGIDTKMVPVMTSQGSIRYETRKPRHYAICLDSLYSRMRLQTERYGVVIIDESEQVFSHFLSEHMESPDRNFNVLSELMRRAEYVFCLDADLGRITLSGVMSCLGRRRGEDLPDERRDYKKLYCFLNDYQPGKRKISIYAGKNDLLNDLRQSIKAGKRCYVVGNSRKFILGLHEAFSQVYKSKKFRVMVSDYGDDEDNRAFLKNIKTEILNYDVVMSSPYVGTGIDITFPDNEVKVDCVYGFFEGAINTHFDIDQQLGRVRHPGEVKAWIMPKRRNFSTDRRKVLQEFLDRETRRGLKVYFDHNGGHSYAGEDPFLELLTDVLIVRNKSMNALKYNFIDYKKYNGWDVELVAQDEKEKAKGSVINKAGRHQQQIRMRERILTARDITFKEAMDIKKLKDKNEPLTDDQKAANEKYWLGKFYHEEVTEKLLTLDDQGKLRERIEMLEILIDPGMKVMTHHEFKNDLTKLYGYRDDKYDRKVIERVVFLRETLTRAGLFDPQTYSLRFDVQYSTNTLVEFINFMQSNEERLQRLFEKEVNSDVAVRPVVQLRTILGFVGIKQQQVKRDRGGDEGEAIYKLDKSSYLPLSKIMTRRKEKAAEFRNNQPTADA